MNTVWIGACASLAISVVPGRKGFSGGVTVRVPSGKITSWPPWRRSLTARRTMVRADLLLM
ncbi:hypothetical protein D3C72_1134600 [compost metagenome]